MADSKPEEMFDPAKLEQIIGQLAASGRLPTEQDFIRQIGKVRTEMKPQILETRKTAGE